MANDIAAQIDEQIRFLHRCRSVFPRLDRQMVGHKSFEAPEYYRRHGHHVEVKLSEPMTVEFIDELNDLAHWLNENFIVRMYAVLESNRVIGEQIKIRRDVDGHEEVDIVRRLRNMIGHGPGHYDQADPNKRQLYERIVTHFQIDHEYSYLDHPTKYPIGVGRVLVPMAEGCKRYAVGIAKKTPSGTSDN